MHVDAFASDALHSLTSGVTNSVLKIELSRRGAAPTQRTGTVAPTFLAHKKCGRLCFFKASPWSGKAFNLPRGKMESVVQELGAILMS